MVIKFCSDSVLLRSHEPLPKPDFTWLTISWVRNSGRAPLGSSHLLHVVAAEVARVRPGDSLSTWLTQVAGNLVFVSAGSVTGAFGQGSWFFSTRGFLGFLPGQWLYCRNECSKRLPVPFGLGLENQHSIISALFYWSKIVTAQIQGGGVYLLIEKVAKNLQPSLIYHRHQEQTMEACLFNMRPRLMFLRLSL